MFDVTLYMLSDQDLNAGNLPDSDSFLSPKVELNLSSLLWKDVIERT